MCIDFFFTSPPLVQTQESFLLHIMCGYQCDKAMTKNDTREVI